MRYLLLFSLFIIACRNTPSNVAQSAGKTIKGDTFAIEKIVSYENLLDSLTNRDAIADVVIRGTVGEVCQTKGCWMTISSSTPGRDTMLVQFKDYGFFMPADLAGKEVIMHGNAYKEITSIEELRYDAREEGLDKGEIDAITEPLEEIVFEASGVVIPD